MACPAPLLERLQRYAIREGDSLESIAAAFELVPATLVRLNPVLATDGQLPVGREIFVPPFNGVRVEIPPGATWQDLAAAYGLRADALFELNGCQPQPQEIFVPGVRWVSRDPNAPPGDYTGFAALPLPGPLATIVPYGSTAAGFHSGLDLAAALGTPVRAVAAGEVVFAGTDPTYGNLVVVNHPGKRQTRYAHLDRIDVGVGGRVAAGEELGVTGTTGQPDAKEPHLHFEVRFNTPQGWISQDPLLHLTDRPQ